MPGNKTRKQGRRHENGGGLVRTMTLLTLRPFWRGRAGGQHRRML